MSVSHVCHAAFPELHVPRMMFSWVSLRLAMLVRHRCSLERFNVMCGSVYQRFIPAKALASRRFDSMDFVPHSLFVRHRDAVHRR